MLREIEGEAAADGDPGLGVTVYVPPKPEQTGERFASTEFTLTADGSEVTCPAGQTSQYRQRNTAPNATLFRFTRPTSNECALSPQCVANPKQGAFGRSVSKNDCEMEYQRAVERK